VLAEAPEIKMREPNLIELSVHEIENTAGTQVRKVLDKKVIKEYSEWYASGALFPPLIVFGDGSERYILADGFHRLEAAKLAGLDTIACDLWQGGMREALEYALGCNYDHGQPRNAKDLRNAIEIACKDPVWCEWSNRQIAMLCKTTHVTVGKIRDEMGLKPDKVKTKRKKKDGTAVEQPSEKATVDSLPPSLSSLNKANRKTLMDAFHEVMSMPFNGHEAVDRLKLEQGHRVELEYCRDWCAEAIAELEKRDEHKQAS
jgi:hypothetical protein